VVQINWTALTLAVIALFALSGFFRGWWKEAITTAFLAALVFLLATPTLAKAGVDGVNNLVEWTWKFIPNSVLPTVETVFNVTAGQIPALDAGSAGTWLIVLVLFVAASVVITRSSLPNYGAGMGYAVRPTASIFGGLLGGLNGFVVMGLVHEYLDGRSLPGGGQSAVGLATATTQAVARSGVTLTATNAPSITILDSYIPWILVLVGVGVLIMALNSRLGYKKSNNGFRKFYSKEPYGYQKYGK